MNNLISVLLPVYNCDKYLAESIESILNQTYKNFELIIINDGSTDNSLSIIKKYERLDDRIILVSRKNKGLIETLNEGIKLSKGKYIARMDQDDISVNDRLDNQYKYITKNSLDICGGNVITIDKFGNELKYYKKPSNQNDILLTLINDVPFAHPSVMIKKSFLIENNLLYGIYGNRNAEDLDLWLNMYRKGAKFGNINEVVLKYRILKNSMSRVNAKNIKMEVREQLNKFTIEYSKFIEELLKEKLKNFKQYEKPKEYELMLAKASIKYFLNSYDWSIILISFRKSNKMIFLKALVIVLRNL